MIVDKFCLICLLPLSLRKLPGKYIAPDDLIVAVSMGLHLLNTLLFLAWQVIFDNILNKQIPWPFVPEEMSLEAQDLIDRLANNTILNFIHEQSSGDQFQWQSSILL